MKRFAWYGKPKPLLTGGEWPHIFSFRGDALEGGGKADTGLKPFIRMRGKVIPVGQRRARG
jgi:hypothetical protein